MKSDVVPILGDKTYKVLKWTTLMAIPAAGTFYFTLSQIWGLPYGEQVVGTLMAVAVFLGALIGISSRQYHNSDYRFDGSLNVVEEVDKRIYDLALKKDPSSLKDQDEVTFRVQDAQK